MIGIEIKNIDELVEKLRGFDLVWTLNNAIKKSIFILERNAKINTPVRTGLLRNSYETEFWDLEATLRNYREYAPYVEAKRHFLETSVDQSLEPINEIFVNDIDALLAKI